MAGAGPAGLCAEGDVIVVLATTVNMPKLCMAGLAIMPRSLTHVAGGFEARFEFLIDSWAGVTRLDAEDGANVHSLTLDVRPHQYKLAAAGFEEMLAELSMRSAGLIWGLSPGAAAGSAASGALAVVHPAVLRSQLPRFLALLRAYVAAPPTTTIRVTRPRAFDLARRPDLATLRRLSRQPALLRALTGDEGAGRFADPRQPVEQPEVTASLDHPMTRYLAHMLGQLVRRFRISEELLKTARGRPYPDPAVEGHAALLAKTMADAVGEVEGWLARPLLKRIRPEPLDSSALQALADHPTFGALHRIGRLLLNAGLAYGPKGTIESALKRSYDLFELFVLFRLADGLAAAMGPPWTRRPTKERNALGWEERPINRAAWWFDGPDGLSVELRYQQWFSRVRPAPDGRLFSSLSGVGVPDYILIVRRGPKPVGWVILDAKYRSGQQAVDDGLADVHRYRDALRVRGIPAEGAFVIVPQLQDAGAPYASLDFLKQQAFGVIRLFEDEWLEPVRSVLMAICARCCL